MEKITAFGEMAKETTKPVFGIDLGTTNSAISVIVQGDAPETIKLKNGEMTMPSCVMWDHGKIVVGREAYNNREKECSVYSVKRFMQDPQAVVYVKDLNDKLEFKPEEVSAEILKGLVELTGGMYGKVEDVVVTVPAYFDQNGVNATKRACELAGLNLIGIANEPTAASLCYRLAPEDGETKDVLVYDLGGGTFDATIMRISDNSANSDFNDLYGFDAGEQKHSVVTLAIDGDTHLGGDDVDEEMLKIVCARLKEFGIDATKFKPSYLEGMKLRLEQFKKGDATLVYGMNVHTINTDGIEIKQQIMIYPTDFEEATRVIFERTKKIVDRLLKSVSHNVKTFVLTGGSTKNPFLQSMLHAEYPEFEIDYALSPDLAVSQGAAVQGKVTKFGDSNIQIFDILPLTIGIREADGRLFPFIERGTSLPTVRTVPFTTDKDNQSIMTFEIMQGNTSFADECVSLGKLRIDGISGGKAGEVSVPVTIKITADRLLTCLAGEGAQQKQIELDLTGDVGTRKTFTEEERQKNRFMRSKQHLNETDGIELEKMINRLGKDVTSDEIKKFIKEHRVNKIE